MRLIVDSQAAYDRFVRRVIMNKVVWCLIYVESDYPVYCLSHDVDTDVFPFWSDRAYAKQCQKLVEQKTEIDTIQLEAFLSKTLPHLVENGFLVGPNWDRNFAGSEVDPVELGNRLSGKIN